MFLTGTLMVIAGIVMSTIGVVKAIKSRGYDWDAPFLCLGAAVISGIGTFLVFLSQISFYKVP